MKRNSRNNNSRLGQRRPPHNNGVVRSNHHNSNSNINRATNNLVSVIIKRHKDKNGGHPHIILDDIDDKYVSVGLSSKATKGNSKKSGKNYKMEHSPINNGRQSYLRREGTVDYFYNYGSSHPGYISNNDFEKVKYYGNKAKKKYLDKK